MNMAGVILYAKRLLYDVNVKPIHGNTFWFVFLEEAIMME